MKIKESNIKKYDKNFFNNILLRNLPSAEIIVPFIVEGLKPKSVVDIGCGIGAWLSVFKRKGAAEIFGIDGDWVKKEYLIIPQKCFQVVDLSKPFKLKKTYDLAICLEVAEHLPEEQAENFIKELTQSAPVIVFSAAIPFQGGTNHINEQWPDYWVKLFENEGYCVSDCFRSKFWEEEKIACWYRQNMFLFFKKDKEHQMPLTSPLPFRCVHPTLFEINMQSRIDISPLHRKHFLARICNKIHYFLMHFWKIPA